MGGWSGRASGAARRRHSPPPAATDPAAAGDSRAVGRRHRPDAPRPALLPLQGAHRLPGECAGQQQHGTACGEGAAAGSTAEWRSQASRLGKLWRSWLQPAAHALLLGAFTMHVLLPSLSLDPPFCACLAPLAPLQGMSLVPAVTELVLAEMLYLQYDNPTRPIFMYINSTGVVVSQPGRALVHTAIEPGTAASAQLVGWHCRFAFGWGLVPSCPCPCCCCSLLLPARLPARLPACPPLSPPSRRAAASLATKARPLPSTTPCATSSPRWPPSAWAPPLGRPRCCWRRGSRGGEPRCPQPAS